MADRDYLERKRRETEARFGVDAHIDTIGRDENLGIRVKIITKVNGSEDNLTQVYEQHWDEILEQLDDVSDYLHSDGFTVKWAYEDITESGSKVEEVIDRFGHVHLAGKIHATPADEPDPEVPELDSPFEVSQN